MSEYVSFEQFKKIELRIGRIVSVENHPAADKLYIMKIDIGGKLVQSVAGLKPYITKEALENRLVAVVCNLEPAMLRGVRSEAMLLAAQEGEKVVLLVPETEISVGSIVK
jgi:methionyl-tRNA synthetase